MDIRVVLWTCLVMTAIMTCTHTLFLPMLFSILVMGIVPGTTLKIPTGIMLTVYPALCMVGVYWLSTLQLDLGNFKQGDSPVTKKAVRNKPSQRPTKQSESAIKRRARAVV
jgi:hypothetical protein